MSEPGLTPLRISLNVKLDRSFDTRSLLTPGR